VNSFTKDGFLSAEKHGLEQTSTSFITQKQQVAKSIPEDKIKFTKSSPHQNQARKASVGVISPSQTINSLLDNKLVFSGS